MVFLLTDHGILYWLLEVLLPWTGRVEPHIGSGGGLRAGTAAGCQFPLSASIGPKCHTTDQFWEVRLGPSPPHNLQPQTTVVQPPLGPACARYLDPVWLRKTHHVMLPDQGRDGHHYVPPTMR